ncbi:MAG: hypothetical protein JWM64_2989 [Frankiales bacterium]|nr:hypothetical protein [Frankiales bacterium]
MRHGAPVSVGGSMSTAALLVVSFALGAATEVELLPAGGEARRLSGSSATAYESFELVFDGSDADPVLGGTEQVVPVLVDPDWSRAADQARDERPPGEPAPVVRTGLDRGQKIGVDHAGYADPEEVGARRCARVVAVAARTNGLPEGEEDAAVGIACRAALAQDEGELRSPPLVDPDADPGVQEREVQRARELYRLAARQGDLRPRVVSLQAEVVPGTRTRSAVAVRLTGPAGVDPPRDVLVRAAYSGGSVVGTTGADGTALLPLPDVALREPLPVTVSWRGSAPAGTRVGPSESPYGAETRTSGEPRWQGWLREDLPSSLSVTLEREGL